MSIFDKIKSVFVEEVETKSDKDKDVPPSEPEPSIPQENKSVREDIEKFQDILFEALEKGNVEGFDYLEFIRSISNLKKQNINNDEKTLFLSAYALSKTMNVDKDAILTSADYYLDLLNKEKVKFNDALVNKAAVKIKDKKENRELIINELERDKIEFDKLKKRIETNNKTLEKIEQELITANTKVKNIKVGFEQALTNLSSKILTDKEKIQKYIK